MELQLPGDLPTPKPFVPSVQYSHVGDLLKVYWDEEEAFARQLTPEITILIGFKSGRVVGVKVANVKSKVEKD